MTSPKPCIAQLAQNNHDRLKTAYTSLLADDAIHGKAVAAFAGHIREHGRPAKTMRLESLLRYLDSERLLNCYQLARLDAAKSGRGQEEHLRERLKGWYVRRIGFDRSFAHGEDFHYAFLWIGGAGSDTYGKVSIVGSRKPEDSWRISVCLTDDSLIHYCTDDGSVLWEPLNDGIAGRDHRHLLAALKHARDLPGADESAWPLLLCQGKCYMEVVFVGDLAPTALEKVVMETAELDRLSDLLADAHLGTLDPEYQADADDFSRLLEELLPRHGLRLEAA